ncbi:aspartate--tRNA ligase [Candidatus Woesearchaeota archaeon]|nr:aspartate--tRNA ligase [Candidatus Woesearchaeota archaeon]
MLRTHTCGELRKEHENLTVTLCGWADHIRIQSKFGFINLRDRYGITQLFLEKELCAKLKDVKKESVLKATGIVTVRPAPNKNLETGEIEVQVKSLELLNEADQLPIDLTGIESSEETRLTYRYLELRRKHLQKNLVLRHKIVKAVRDFFDKQNFLEIETPILCKSTPEGARDYLVPSRVNPGRFYALPQSPQLFKQLLMVAGYDRYVQIARCFRDEDLRADRQPEFTQIDIEMSYLTEEDIFSLMERMMKQVLKEVLNKDIEIPFPRMSWKEAMEKHKTDKPDLRKNKEEFAFLWVVDFPLLEYKKEEGRYYCMHHPFTMPKEEDLHLLDKDPEKARARSYDLVLNGWELGGGSIRIHKRDLQEKIFKVLGISKEEAQKKFGFLLNAFRYGTPPHGGMAIGLDRFVSLLAGEESIREVIAFPKNKDARDLMLDAPSDVEKEQLNELNLQFKK